MKRCIQLAKNGLGSTYPNPLVGSVLVYQDTIIGEGWHYQAGHPHAEVHAIKSVANNRVASEILKTEGFASSNELLSKATIYVCLEPCNHTGKTPPCADLIIASGIQHVIIGSTDPNPKVAGRGIAKLKAAGCAVTQGVLEAECNELNKRFFTFQNKKRPYIILKWAQSEDGYIAPTTRDRRAPVWITNPFSRQRVHQLRAEEKGVLIGTTTALEDNPSLTVRDWYGSNPTRIIIDRNLKIPATSSIYNSEASTIIITEQKETTRDIPNTVVHPVTFQKRLASQLCEIAYKNDLQSIIIEGGAQTLQTFIDENLWDEAQVYIGTTRFDDGVKAPILKASILKTSTLKKDLCHTFKNTLT